MKEIEEKAFYGCTGLVSVVIQDGVEKIRCDAFNGCTNLTSVVIPDSVKTIENGAFPEKAITPGNRRCP